MGNELLYNIQDIYDDFFGPEPASNQKQQNNYKSSPVNLKKSIKSFYIFQNVFLYLQQKKRFQMIIYNKQIQKKVGINIEDYKRLSGKYRCIEKDGIGKEYNLLNNKLLFEGQYVNGKKHGKGKEYFENGNIKFKGKYLKGRKIRGRGYNNNQNIIFVLKSDGKATEYYDNGNLKFEGEYFDEKRWNGRGYNIKGEMIYIIKSGKGKVIDYYDNGELKFEGEYIHGEKNGKGKEYNKNGIIAFEGQYLNGKRHGIGKEYNKNAILIYEGEFLSGKRNGIGKEYNDDCILIYEGKYLNDKKNGYGKEYDQYSGALIYEGEFLDEKRIGKGKIFSYHANGELALKVGCLNGEKNGKGYEYNEKGILIFKENFQMIKEMEKVKNIIMKEN